MSSTLAVRVNPPSGNEVSARFSVGKKSFTVRTSANVSLASGATPWLAPGLLAAMRQNAALDIDGPLDSVALTGAEEVQRIMSDWYPAQMHATAILQQETTNETLAGGRGVGCFFSGGVDSFYSTVKHIDEITHLIFIHGFDIPLDNEDLAERTLRTLRKAAEDLGKPLIEVRTNLRQVHALLGLDWESHSHGSLLAHVALLLTDHIGKLYLPSNRIEGELEPYATHPDLDKHWGSRGLEIEHDGNEANRPMKVAAFADSEPAMNNLRVCWWNKDNDYNCGHCEKCIRTMMNIKIAGAEGKCATLPADIPYDVYNRMYINKPGKHGAVENLKAMDDFGYRDAEMERALRDAIDRPTWQNQIFHARQLAGLAPQFAGFLWKMGTGQLSQK
ncbi:hypothetical protein [Tomitella cavernea]|uniref:hypothetical protein n=1 Tax=Tomitella cavernea TaxID=1387982 RepID=UPI0019074BA9|nr:hypothetical protein [Tomitella cavernea]